MLFLVHDGKLHAEATEADTRLVGPDDKPLFDIREVPDGAVGWVEGADGTFAAPPGIEVPTVIPDVSSAQAKIQLSRAGFLPAVKASVDAIGGEVEIWFTDARTWQRSNPHVTEIGTALSLTPVEIDELFVAASKISA